MRSLYECTQAIVCGQRIKCYRGYRFDSRTKDGSIDLLRLARGEPLNMAVCQECPEFKSMGPPVSKAERGWLHLYGKDGRYPADLPLVGG